MVIITSNEDLIHQICLNKTENTRIIDLNESNSTSSSISNNNNGLLDLTFLAEFSELNSTNDQIYKGVLDSRQYSRSKVLKRSKKESNLICVICEDDAIGFNYDVLTCASCKAFFRRNAQHNLEKIRCRTGQNRCPISHNNYRKCQRCRLEKCFAMGMRKDFILSEEEKQKRRERLEGNRQLVNERQSSTESISSSTNQYISESLSEIDRLLMDTDEDNPVNDDKTDLDEKQNISYERISMKDWSDIESIRTSYLSIFQNQNLLCRSFDTSDRNSALISWSQFASQTALQLIHFFQQIDEFENLNIDDRFTLTKYNLLPLYMIQKCFNYNPLTGTFINRRNEDVLKRRQFFALCYGTGGIREKFMNMIRSLSKVTEQDSVLLNLLLVILLFSKGLSMSENEPALNDEIAVNRAQSHYIKLTWNYLVYKLGEKNTSKKFIQILTEIERLQSFTKYFREFFLTQTKSKDTLERFAPLIQAVLNIN
ncbi:unnamed protein product [Rotaria sordida]|uniref:Uncharacterized protein n=1 Tax=Rotaria sordida TaxID=392033 RepID=A0A815DX46_9BILA|nr:unnamed protein product [Rotaria sordida]